MNLGGGTRYWITHHHDRLVRHRIPSRVGLLAHVLLLIALLQSRGCCSCRGVRGVTSSASPLCRHQQQGRFVVVIIIVTIFFLALYLVFFRRYRQRLQTGGAGHPGRVRGVLYAEQNRRDHGRGQRDRALYGTTLPQEGVRKSS